MAQVDVTYSDNHTIDVDSNKKIKDVTLSGKYEDGYDYKQDLTNDLPFTFNPQSLGLLKNSIFNLNIQVGGEEMRTWLLQPQKQILSYMNPSSSTLEGNATYACSMSTKDVSTFFDYLSSDAITIIDNMENACGCDILTTAVFTVVPYVATTSTSADEICCGQKCGFLVGADLRFHETVTVHATNVTKSGTKYYFSPDLVTNTPSLHYSVATNLTSTDIPHAGWNVMVTYYATPMSEFPDGYATTTWGTFT